RSLRRAAHPRNPPLSRFVRLDAALHRHGRRQALSTGLLRAGVFPDRTSGPRRLTIRLADRGIRVVLLDIEGTTTPIAFVHDVLFPFARAHLAGFLNDTRNAAIAGEVTGLLKREHDEERV